jgi:hypothetical protein
MKYMKIGPFLILLLLALLAGCAADTDEVSPTLTIDGMPAINNTSTRNLSGTVEPGATVEVSVNTTATVAALSNVDGLWSVSIANLAPGGNTVTVTATDATGNSNTLLLVLTYEVITLEAYVTPTPASSQTIGGFLAPGAADPAVTIDLAATAGAVTVTGDFWSCDISGLTGGHTVTVTHSDDVNPAQSATAVITFAATALSVTIDPFVNPTTDPLQSFSGTTEAGVTVQVSINGAAGMAAEVTDTTWTFTPTPAVALHEGKNGVSVIGTLVDKPTTVLRTFVVLEPAP